jgi:hypothetical protein
MTANQEHQEPDDRPQPPRYEDLNRANLVPVGGPIVKFKLTLRVFGDDLVPDEISALLGVRPTYAKVKGERLPGRYARVAKTGSWHYTTEFDAASKTEVDMAINQLLDALTSKLNVWRDLETRFKIDLFCGLFMNGGTGNEGFELTPATLQRLAERGLLTGFDIYY